jgi:hypothetical protein
MQGPWRWRSTILSDAASHCYSGGLIILCLYRTWGFEVDTLHARCMRFSSRRLGWQIFCWSRQCLVLCSMKFLRCICEGPSLYLIEAQRIIQILTLHFS